MNESAPLTLTLVDGYSTHQPYDGYTASTSLTSNPIDLTYYGAYSITVSCSATGSPVGSIQVQASADAVNFANVGSPAAISNATTVYFDNGSTGARAIRILYIRSSGSITITAKATLK